MTTSETTLRCPEEPFRGLEPYRFSDQAIFFERETDVRKLIQLTTIYRASLLYGESGSGKSSLINAGFIPRALESKMTAERIRVQPRTGAEFIVERIECSPAGEVLPSRLATAGRSQREILSADSLLAKIRALQGSPVPMLIFDQFEELHTLAFDAAAERGSDASDAHNRIVDTLVMLIHEPKNLARLLFVFREDYLAKFDRLFYLCPELPDRFLRLTPPTVESLPTILRGPFETDRLPSGCWTKEIRPELAARLQEQLRPTGGRTTINLAQVQIVAVQLWRSEDPDDALSHRGTNGLVEDYLEGALALFGRERRAAESLLTFMITRQGTRKVVLETDAVDEAHDEERIPPDTARSVLNRLVTETKLVRRDYYRNAISYEIVSEFLVPWIRTLKLQRAARQARSVWLRRAAILFVIFAAILGAVFFWRWNATTKELMVAGYRQEVDQLEQNLKVTQDRAKETLKLLSASNDERVKKLAAQVADLEKSTGANRQEITAKNLELAKAQEGARQLQIQLKDADGRLTSLNTELDKLRIETRNLKTENGVANSKVMNLTSEIEKLKTENQNLRDQIETLKKAALVVNPPINKPAIHVQPKPIRQPKPSYPPLARQAHISGIVRLKAIIGKDGTIQNLTLVSGHPLLVPAAVDAVKQWVYTPALVNGEPVEEVISIDVEMSEGASALPSKSRP